MSSVWEQLVEAHNEVLAAFGFNSTTDLLDRVTSAVSGPSGDGGGVFDGISQFIQAVEWSDPFFSYLGGFHLALWAVAFGFCWRSSTRAMVMMALLLGLVALSSTLNNLGQQHYRSIFAPRPSLGDGFENMDPAVKKMIEDSAGGRKLTFGVPAAGEAINYFDKNGVFISAVYSAPMLLLAFLLQVRLIFLMVVMMVKVKKLQLRSGAQANEATTGDAQVAKKKQKKNQ